MNKSVYALPCKPGQLYVNLGNDCLNECRFCVKRYDTFFGYELNEPHSGKTLSSVILDLGRIKQKGITPSEVVICGTGEPFLHYDEVITISSYAKNLFKNTKIRADTTGLWWKNRPDMSFLDYITSSSVSLNAESAEKYEIICQPKIANSYETLIDFLEELKCERIKRTRNGLLFPDIRLTIVDTSETGFMPERKTTDRDEDCPVPDIKKCQEIADELGFPLVVKHLFQDVNDSCWKPEEFEDQVLKGESLEKCINCNNKHI